VHESDRAADEHAGNDAPPELELALAAAEDEGDREGDEGDKEGEDGKAGRELDVPRLVGRGLEAEAEHRHLQTSRRAGKVSRRERMIEERSTGGCRSRRRGEAGSE